MKHQQIRLSEKSIAKLARLRQIQIMPACSLNSLANFVIEHAPDTWANPPRPKKEKQT